MIHEFGEVRAEIGGKRGAAMAWQGEGQTSKGKMGYDLFPIPHMTQKSVEKYQRGALSTSF